MRWRFPLILLWSALIMVAWWRPNTLRDPGAGTSVGKFNCLSYAGYRPGESPLNGHFPTASEVDADLALLAPRTRAIRTYAAIEGPYDTAALAQKHGLKLWQGIWLGADRAQNVREIAQGIALAKKYPDTIERVVVGNEVLLRRDLPVAELMADIDQVRAAVKQPVAYADVSDFWAQFPQVAKHVDVALIHLLPYWEDKPTSAADAVAYVGAVFDKFSTILPGTKLGIGETGWPSRGRQREGALPSRVNEAAFLRGFMALSQARHMDYNFIEAFDQDWKYKSEGVVGANWGLLNADRTEKFPLTGPLREDPDWLTHSFVGIAAGLFLALLGLLAKRPGGWGEASLIGLGMELGAALGFAIVTTLPVLYDRYLALAAFINLPGQALLAGLMMLRAAGRLPAAPGRTGADATRMVRRLSRGQLPPAAGLLEDVTFLFAWTAAILQILLVFDPRYREFPLNIFAVPLVVTLARGITGDWPGFGGGREEMSVGLALAGGAVASAIIEGPLNNHAIVWNLAALILAAPLLWRCRRIFAR